MAYPYSFTVPADWDKPSDENALRCEKFRKRSYSLNGVTVPYRLYVPEKKPQGSCPLVLFMHGADTVGEDNEYHITLHDVGTVFASAAWQDKHPCYVAAPQYHRGSYWSIPESAEAVHGLLLSLMGEFPDIDQNRIYVYGFSAGGVGVFEQIKLYPSFYAAAIPICGATSNSRWMLRLTANMPTAVSKKTTSSADAQPPRNW